METPASGDLTIGVREAEEKSIGMVVEESDALIGGKLRRQARRAFGAAVELE
jgi:hypothetical protein